MAHVMVLTLQVKPAGWRPREWCFESKGLSTGLDCCFSSEEVSPFLKASSWLDKVYPSCDWCAICKIYWFKCYPFSKIDLMDKTSRILFDQVSVTAWLMSWHIKLTASYNCSENCYAIIHMTIIINGILLKFSYNLINFGVPLYRLYF